MINLYLDDMRPTPEGYVRVYTAQDCIKFLQEHNGEIGVLSLDHDLGACNDCMAGKTPEQWLAESNYQHMPNCDHFGTGYTVCCWIEEQAVTNPEFVLPMQMKVHSANPVGRSRMQTVIDKFYRGD